MQPIIQSKRKMLAKVIALTLLWAIPWLFLHGDLYQSWLVNKYTESTAFVVEIVLSFLSIIVFEIGFLYLFVKRERIKDFRKYFKIERLDTRGIWLGLELGLLLQVINVAFLGKVLLEPAKNFLLELGIPGPQIGLSTGEIIPHLSPPQAMFLSVFLILFWWLEVPEELFFRGYLQNQMQEVFGKNTALFLSALVWALAHLWGLANTLERFLYGCVYAFVFRMRQNTTGTMIDHPLGNRSLLLGFTLPQIIGIQLDPHGSSAWILVAVVYVALILLVIKGWHVLKLDRKTM